MSITENVISNPGNFSFWKGNECENPTIRQFGNKKVDRKEFRSTFFMFYHIYPPTSKISLSVEGLLNHRVRRGYWILPEINGFSERFAPKSPHSSGVE